MSKMFFFYIFLPIINILHWSPEEGFAQKYWKAQYYGDLLQLIFTMKWTKYCLRKCVVIETEKKQTSVSWKAW